MKKSMVQYIDKSALAAEIDRRIKSLQGCKADTTQGYAGEISGLKRLLSFLDTLKVKEVDLDDKGEWKNTGGFGSTWDPDSPDYYPD